MNKADQLIADKLLEDQLNLLRYTAGERQKVFKIFLQMQTELKAKLATGFTPNEKKRLAKLLNSCEAIIKSYYSDMQGQFDFVELAKHEAAVPAKAMIEIGLEASIPSASVLKAMVSDTLLQGAPLADWWAKQAEDTAFKFASQVRQGVVQGETLQQIITRIVGSPKKGITGVMDISRTHASTLVHDSIMQIANDAKMATYEANKDVIKGVRWLATFDGHTCPRCFPRSGMEWDFAGNPLKGDLPFVKPPLHPACRCVLSAVTKSYRELGIDVDEVPIGTRASDLGQIKADTTFDEFFSRHDKQWQDEMLGPKRAEMWRNGKITLRDLLSQEGRPLTLQQLREAA
jgi:hypothetical protein